MWEIFKAGLIAAGILKPDDAANEAKIKAEFDKTNPAPTPTPTPVTGGAGGADPNAAAIAQAVERALAPVVQQVNALSTALSEEKTARATAVQTIQDQEKAARDAKIKTILDEAETAQKFATAERSKWQAKLEKDFDGFKEALDLIPGKAPAPTGGKPGAKPGTTPTTTQTTQTKAPGTFDRATLQQEAASAFKTSTSE